MCLGVPGRIEEVRPAGDGMRMGTVSFGGIRKEVCLSCVPEAEVGEYVLVHVGFAIGKIEEAEARQVFELLKQLGDLEGLDLPAP
jgi:hydrogenase expression/formation protein HypC